MGCVYVYVIVLALIGLEHLRRRFDASHDAGAREVVCEEAFAEDLCGSERERPRGRDQDRFGEKVARRDRRSPLVASTSCRPVVESKTSGPFVKHWSYWVSF